MRTIHDIGANVFGFPKLPGIWYLVLGAFTMVAFGGPILIDPDKRRYQYAQFPQPADLLFKFGGATSQSADRGTWTATETSITASSASGRITTYVLEKRNHPKNNDPMLVLDGQAFVDVLSKGAVALTQFTLARISGRASS